MKIKDSISKFKSNYIKRELSDSQFIQLDRNENRIGYSPYVEKALMDIQKDLFLYPDPFGIKLVKKLASHHDVMEENIIIGNGSGELISDIAQVFLNPGEEAIAPSITFGWYKTATLLANGVFKQIPLLNDAIDLGATLKAVGKQTKLIWICNPNNPTGNLLAEDAILSFLDQVPKEVVIVLDEAYIEFIRNPYNTKPKEWIQKYQNVILLRTFSKVYGLAGLRVGYAMADSLLIEGIRIAKNRCTINSFAIEAATVSLADSNFYTYVTSETTKQLNRLYAYFDSESLIYLESHANFVLVQFGERLGQVIETLKKNQILVRNGSEFGYDGWARITIGNSDDTDILITSLKNVYYQWRL